MTTKTTASQKYAEAHAAQYTAKNLPEALELYTEIIESHSDSVEAGYSRSQVQNIANAVVPKPELLAAQVTMIREHFKTAAGSS